MCLSLLPMATRASLNDITESLSSDKTAVKAGDTFNITVTINGTNNFSLVDSVGISTITSVVKFDSSVFTYTGASLLTTENTIKDDYGDIYPYSSDSNKAFFHSDTSSTSSYLNDSSGGADNSIDMYKLTFTVKSNPTAGSYTFAMYQNANKVTSICSPNAKSYALTDGGDVSVMVQSSDSSLKSVLGQSVTTAGAGTKESPSTGGIKVANSVTSISATDIVATSSTSTVTFYGADSGFETAASSVPLAASDNKVYIKVQAEDGTSTYYALTVGYKSADSSIASILSKTLTSTGTGTSASPKTALINVAKSVSSMTALNVATTDSNATVALYGSDSTFGTAVSSANLDLGDNNVYIRVTAEDATSTYYQVDVVRASMSTDAKLKSVLSQSVSTNGTGTMASPESVSVSVANAVSEILTTDIAANDSGATVTLYGADNSFTTATSGSVSLVAGNTTTVYASVKAEDSSVAYYTMSITRAAPTSADETIKSVLSKSVITSGTGTAENPESVSVSVANAVSAISSADIITNASGAKVKFYGTGSGFTTEETGSSSLTVGGVTTVYVKVETEGGSSAYYAMAITRASAASTDANLNTVLSQIISATGTGTAESPETATISVANTVTSLQASDIVPTDSGATVTLYGADSTFKTPLGSSDSMTLTTGRTTTVYISVTSTDGTTMYYAVSVSVAAPVIPTFTVNSTGLAALSNLRILTYTTGGGTTYNLIRGLMVGTTNTVAKIMTYFDLTNGTMKLYKFTPSTETYTEVQITDTTAKTGSGFKVEIYDLSGTLYKTFYFAVMGDLNSDGNVNTQDVSIEQKHVTKATLIKNDIIFYCGNVISPTSAVINTQDTTSMQKQVTKALQITQ